MKKFKSFKGGYDVQPWHSIPWDVYHALLVNIIANDGHYKVDGYDEVFFSLMQSHVNASTNQLCIGIHAGAYLAGVLIGDTSTKTVAYFGMPDHGLNQPLVIEAVKAMKNANLNDFYSIGEEGFRRLKDKCRTSSNRIYYVEPLHLKNNEPMSVSLYDDEDCLGRFHCDGVFIPEIVTWYPEKSVNFLKTMDFIKVHYGV